MHTIEEEMIRAARYGNGFCKGNTCLTWNESGNAFYVALHGNTIARGELDMFGIPRLTAVNLCGWNTVTTRSRIRAFGVPLTTKKGVPYIGKTEIPESGWMELYAR